MLACGVRLLSVPYWTDDQAVSTLTYIGLVLYFTIIHVCKRLIHHVTNRKWNEDWVCFSPSFSNAIFSLALQQFLHLFLSLLPFFWGFIFFSLMWADCFTEVFEWFHLDVVQGNILWIRLTLLSTDLLRENCSMNDTCSPGFELKLRFSFKVLTSLRYVYLI